MANKTALGAVAGFFDRQGIVPVLFNNCGSWQEDYMKRMVRKFTADTLALIFFSAATCAFGLLFERLVMGLSLVQMGVIRFVYNALKYGLAEYCARIADTLRARLAGNSKHLLRRALADGLALSGYQIPLYVFCALLARAEPEKVAIMAVFYLGNNLVLGWFYGIVLNRVRSWFALRLPET